MGTRSPGTTILSSKKLYITFQYQFTIYCLQIQKERDDLYNKFVKAIYEVQQKSGFKNLLLEKKLTALADTLEKKVHQHLSVILRAKIVL